MQPAVIFRSADGRLHRVPHGGIIGRLTGAALVLPDPRLSEAHAMVSLRGRALHLLTLRGRFACRGLTPSSLELKAGQRIQFARGLELEVLRVDLPERVLALSLPDQEPRVLVGVVSLVRVGEPALIQGYEPSALAVFWSQDGQWQVRLDGQSARPLEPGDLQIGDLALRCSWLRLQQAALPATQHRGGLAVPLVLISHYDSLQIRRQDQEPLIITGNAARIVGELVAFGGPVEWQTLAGEIWGDLDSIRLRRNLDQTLLRLRKKLEGGRIRPDLVRSDGGGKLELVLLQGETLEDRS